MLRERSQLSDPASGTQRSDEPRHQRDDMRDAKALISTEQLAAALGQPDLRVFDCTTYLEPTPAGSDDPYVAVSGRRTFEEAHIPGADYLDLQGEFSDP